MSTKVKIEIDERTADALQARAAVLGLTVSQLVAELATLEAESITVPPDEIAELDRRWKKIPMGGICSSAIRRRSGSDQRSMAPASASVAYALPAAEIH